MYLQCIDYHLGMTYTLSENLRVRLPEWTQTRESGKDARTAMMTEMYARRKF